MGGQTATAAERRRHGLSSSHLNAYADPLQGLSTLFSSVARAPRPCLLSLKSTGGPSVPHAKPSPDFVPAEESTASTQSCACTAHSSARTSGNAHTGTSHASHSDPHPAAPPPACGRCSR